MNYMVQVVMESMNIIIYQLKHFKKEDTNLRQASPPIILVIIHHTIMTGTYISYSSTDIKKIYIFFPVALTAINVISSVQEKKLWTYKN